eukprot:gene408-15878_t
MLRDAGATSVAEGDGYFTLSDCKRDIGIVKTDRDVGANKNNNNNSSAINATTGDNNTNNNNNNSASDASRGEGDDDADDLDASRAFLLGLLVELSQAC